MNESLYFLQESFYFTCLAVNVSEVLLIVVLNQLVEHTPQIAVYQSHLIIANSSFFISHNQFLIIKLFILSCYVSTKFL